MHTHISVSTALYKLPLFYLYLLSTIFFFFSLVEHASNTKLKKMLYLQHNETEDL